MENFPFPDCPSQEHFISASRSRQCDRWIVHVYRNMKMDTGDTCKLHRSQLSCNLMFLRKNHPIAPTGFSICQHQALTFSSIWTPLLNLGQNHLQLFEQLTHLEYQNSLLHFKGRKRQQFQAEGNLCCQPASVSHYALFTYDCPMRLELQP